MKSQIFLLFLLQFDPLIAWESYELDLFDLVEEIGVNKNFYEFLSIEKTADLSEIKKAYRKLSLLWHPDKSDESNAEQKFRQLVGVYEILKDEQRRARYDRILVEGLPKWNQPMFYFRRAKKLRFWEIFTILSLIVTIGHYFVLWAIYFESSLSMNERSTDVRKRLEKKLKKSTKVKEIDQTLIDEEIARILPALRSPRLVDILPIRLAQILVDHRFFVSQIFTTIRRWRQSSMVVVDDDEEEKVEDRPTKSPVVRINDFVPQMASNTNAPVVSYLTPISSSPTSETLKFNRPWTDEDKQLLCKTIVRFPMGTPRRWEKIAEVLVRHVSHVTEMAKQIQNTVGTSGNIFQENFLTTMNDENLLSERSTNDWSQTDQNLFETALKNVSKDLPAQERWEQISRCVPGKTPAECLARYRSIVQMVRAKKMS